jgi:hypothetical protein
MALCRAHDFLMRPAILVEYERQAEARMLAFYPDVTAMHQKSEVETTDFNQQEIVLFGAMYEQLTSDERAAHAQLLMTDATDGPDRRSSGSRRSGNTTCKPGSGGVGKTSGQR